MAEIHRHLQCAMMNVVWEDENKRRKKEENQIENETERGEDDSISCGKKEGKNCNDEEIK